MKLLLSCFFAVSVTAVFACESTVDYAHGMGGIMRVHYDTNSCVPTSVDRINWGDIAGNDYYNEPVTAVNGSVAEIDFHNYDLYPDAYLDFTADQSSTTYHFIEYDRAPHYQERISK